MRKILFISSLLIFSTAFAQTQKSDLRQVDSQKRNTIKQYTYASDYLEPQLYADDIPLVLINMFPYLEFPSPTEKKWQTMIEQFLTRTPNDPYYCSDLQYPKKITDLETESVYWEIDTINGLIIYRPGDVITLTSPDYSTSIVVTHQFVYVAYPRSFLEGYIMTDASPIIDCDAFENAQAIIKSAYNAFMKERNK